MDFIFMLTHRDRTVEDCLAVLEDVAPLGVRHIGFKDVGVGMKTLKALNARIKSHGGSGTREVPGDRVARALSSIADVERVEMPRAPHADQ